MEKRITVKGIGRATAKPDTIVLTMSLKSHAQEYDKAMEIAANSISNITKAIEGVGFEKDMVKTINFNVQTKYDSFKDRNGNYRSKFNGFLVCHDLKLEFDIDTKLLSKVLSVLARTEVNPELSVSFIIKDSTVINEEMLRSATENALKKAKVLCDASNVTLGNLILIDYNWGELNVCSNTSYNLNRECLLDTLYEDDIDIEPDDIDVRDTVTFVWEIN